MKKVFLALVLAFGAAAQAEDVLLQSRYSPGGSYEETATYSFRKMSHDVNLTRNNWDVLFEGRADFADHFRVNTVTDDRSNIYDLGRSCDPNSLDRTKAQQTDMIKVVQGNCYLIEGMDSRGSVVAIFRVKTHMKSELVVLSDIQVLSQQDFERK